MLASWADFARPPRHYRCATPNLRPDIMFDIRTSEITTLSSEGMPPGAAPAGEPCEECVGTGGWYRYEPALDPAPGMLYLSCLNCRGKGRFSALASA
jgi:hypothetical protein